MGGREGGREKRKGERRREGGRREKEGGKKSIAIVVFLCAAKTCLVALEDGHYVHSAVPRRGQQL